MSLNHAMRQLLNKASSPYSFSLASDGQGCDIAAAGETPEPCSFKDGTEYLNIPPRQKIPIEQRKINVPDSPDPRSKLMANGLIREEKEMFIESSPHDKASKIQFTRNDQRHTAAFTHLISLLGKTHTQAWLLFLAAKADEEIAKSSTMFRPTHTRTTATAPTCADAAMAFFHRRIMSVNYFLDHCHLKDSMVTNSQAGGSGEEEHEGWNALREKLEAIFSKLLLNTAAPDKLSHQKKPVITLETIIEGTEQPEIDDINNIQGNANDAPE